MHMALSSPLLEKLETKPSDMRLKLEILILHHEWESLAFSLVGSFDDLAIYQLWHTHVGLSDVQAKRVEIILVTST